jgi:hypothetical protein
MVGYVLLKIIWCSGVMDLKSHICVSIAVGPVFLRNVCRYVVVTFSTIQDTIPFSVNGPLVEKLGLTSLDYCAV